jgi:hypothetical protein
MKQNSTFHVVIDNLSKKTDLINVDEVLEYKSAPDLKNVFKHLNSYKRTVREEVVQRVLDFARNLQE